MRSIRRIERFRRIVAAGLLAWYLPGCYSWKPGYLAPSEMTNQTVQVTTTGGARTRLHKAWVSGDSLLGHRAGVQGFISKDTTGVALADISAIQVGNYKGVTDPVRTIPLAVGDRGVKLARVVTAGDTLLLVHPWVTGDSLFGLRNAVDSARADTVAVALSAIRRLELRRYDGGRTGGLIAVAIIGTSAAGVAIACASGGCGMHLGGW